MDEAKLNTIEELGSSQHDTALPQGDALLEALRSYEHLVIWALDGVSITEASALQQLPEDLLELRAFNRDGELHLVKAGDQTKGRIRRDGGSGEPALILDEEHLLWGSPKEFAADGGVLLTNDRGTRIQLPPGIATGASSERVTLTVRNYIDRDSFDFVDWRLVSFNVREA